MKTIIEEISIIYFLLPVGVKAFPSTKVTTVLLV